MSRDDRRAFWFAFVAGCFLWAVIGWAAWRVL
jgi:hypothetical protein